MNKLTESTGKIKASQFTRKSLINRPPASACQPKHLNRLRVRGGRLVGPRRQHESGCLSHGASAAGPTRKGHRHHNHNIIGASDRSERRILSS